VYDSIFGNTTKIAEAIAKSLGAGARMVAVPALKEDGLAGVELVVVGCPINGWRPSAGMGKFLGALRAGQLQGVKAATFDTRVKSMFHGDAAGKIGKALQRAGANMVASPEPFYVAGKEGPLVAGELERAAAWGQSLAGAPAAS
jgi:flavodoxin